MSTWFNLCLNQCLLFLINVPKINHHRHQIFPPINQSYYYSTLSLGLGCFIWIQVFRSQKFPTPLQHLILSLILIKSHAYYSQSRSHIGKHPAIKTDWHRCGGTELTRKTTDKHSHKALWFNFYDFSFPRQSTKRKVQPESTASFRGARRKTVW